MTCAAITFQNLTFWFSKPHFFLLMRIHVSNTLQKSFLTSDWTVCLIPACLTLLYLSRYNPLPPPQLGPNRKYCPCSELSVSSTNIQGRVRDERERCTNQVQVCLITHIKVDRGTLKMSPGSCPLVKVSGEMFTAPDDQGEWAVQDFDTLVHTHTQTHTDPHFSLPTLQCSHTHLRTHTHSDWETLMLVHTTL